MSYNYIKIFHLHIFRIFNLILILQILPLLCNELHKQLIVIPFKSYYPEINDNDGLVKYISSMIKRKLYWESENEDGQKISVIMSLRWSSMHTSNSVAFIWNYESIEYYYKPNPKDICKFDYKKSKNYKFVTPYNKSFFMHSKSCYAMEKFKFFTDIQINKNNADYYDIEFIHTVNDTEICFFDGLQLTADEKS